MPLGALLALVMACYSILEALPATSLWTVALLMGHPTIRPPRVMTNHPFRSNLLNFRWNTWSRSTHDYSKESRYQ